MLIRPFFFFFAFFITFEKGFGVKAEIQDDPNPIDLLRNDPDPQSDQDAPSTQAKDISSPPPSTEISTLTTSSDHDIGGTAVLPQPPSCTIVGSLCMNGTPKMVGSDCQCDCESGWTGDRCDTTDVCKPNPCHHGGECLNKPGEQYYCDCNFGYLPPNCMDRDPCVLDEGHCLNGATCRRIGDLDFTCACQIPYEGDHCETMNLCNLDKGECLDLSQNSSIPPGCFPCSQNILPKDGCIFNETMETYECNCLPGWGGPICDIRSIRTELLSRITLPVLNLEDMWPHHFIVHKLWVPYNRTLMMAVNGTTDFDVHISIKQKYRPTCWDVKKQYNQTIPMQSKLHERWSNDEYQGDIYQRIPYDIEYPVDGTVNETTVQDFYMIIWPEAPAIDGNRPVEVTLHYGIYVVNCTFMKDLAGAGYAPVTEDYENCFAAKVNTTTSPNILICECQGPPFDVIAPYLTPIEYLVEVYQPLELFNRSRFRYCHIIPWVVLGCTVLYLFFLVILLLSDWGSSRRPKLIVMTDIRKIAVETFYLLTLETGTPLCASSSAKIAIQIYGTCCRTKPMILSDYTIVTTRHNDEDNFLFSTEKDLGDATFIRLWHDNQGYSPNWYCKMVTLKNIKTGKSWYFYANEWLAVYKSTLIISVRVATPKQIEVHRRGRFGEVLEYQFREKHLVFSPFLCASRSLFKRSERWTLLLTTVFLYMFILICFYGFPKDRDPGIILAYDSYRILKESVILRGLYAALVGLPFILGIFLFFTFGKRKRVPTLLACGSGTLKNPKAKPERPPPPANPDYRRWNNLDPDRPMVVGVPKGTKDPDDNANIEVPPIIDMKIEKEELPLMKGMASESSEAFQVPSTSVSKTENWIGSYLTTPDFPEPIRKLQPPPEGKPYDKILQDGVVGAVTAIKDADPLRLVYKDGEEPEERHVDDKIAREIRTSFGHPLWMVPEIEGLLSSSQTLLYPEGKEKDVKHVRIDSKSPLYVDPPPVQPSWLAENKASQTTFAYEDPYRMKREDGEAGKPPDEYEFSRIELCETEDKTSQSRLCFPRWFFYLLLFICLCIMITCGVITVMFGRRYGFSLSIDWCFSFLWALFFAFLAFETVRIIIMAVVAFILQRRQKTGESRDEKKARLRFRLLWFREGPCNFPRKWPLNYTLFFPTYIFLPLSSYRMFFLRMEDRRLSRLCQNLIDISFFLMYITCIIILCYYMRSVEYYNSSSNIEELFKINVNDKHLPDSFWGINRTERFYSYMDNTFLSQIQEGKATESDLMIWRHGHVNKVLGFQWLKNDVTILLGPVRLRQERVEEYPCEATFFPKRFNMTMACQREYVNTWFKHTKDTGTYGLGWQPLDNQSSFTNRIDPSSEVDPTNRFGAGPGSSHPRNCSLSPEDHALAFGDAWKYKTAEETDSVFYQGYHSYYDGGGYTVLLNRDVNISRDILCILEKDNWIDLRTRAIFIEFNTFNPSVDLYNVHVFAVERTSYNSWNMSTRTFTTRFPFVNESMSAPHLILFLAVGSIMILCIIYFLANSAFSFVQACKSIGYKGLSYSWLWVDLAIGLISVACFVLFTYSLREGYYKVEHISPYTIEFVNFQYAAFLRNLFLHTNCVLLVMCYIKFWRLFVLSNRRFYVLGFTLSLTRRQVLGAALYFLIVLFAFGSFYHIVFGLHGHQFITFPKSVTNLIQVAKVSSAVSFRALCEYDSVIGPTFYLLYNGIAYFLMINVIISVLTMGLQEAQDSARRRSFKHDYVYFVWSNIKKIIPRQIISRSIKMAVAARLAEKNENQPHPIRNLQDIPPERWVDMKIIVRDKLLELLEHESVQKMKEMKEYCNQHLLPEFDAATAAKGPVERRRTRMISKEEKFRIYKRKHLKIPERRLNIMKALTRGFVKTKTGHDFSAQDLKGYHEFNQGITTVTIKKLEWKINSLEQLIGGIN